MLRIALTGNAAAGKSTVARLLESWGVTVIDADRIVHELQSPGTPLLARIAQRFGPAVVMPSGALDRARLRSLVLADSTARRDLETMVHPEVERRRLALESEARQRGVDVIVHDLPLLFEAMDPGAFDAVILVEAPESVRLARLRDRGLGDQEARDLLAAQEPSSRKRAWRGGPRQRPAYLIENSGGLPALEARLREVWREVVAG